jgi:hypothetical protein
MESNRRPFNFNFIFLEIERNHRVPNHGNTVGGGWQPFSILPETAGWGRECEMWRCHGEAARPVLANVRGNVFVRFHSVAGYVIVQHGIHIWPVGTGASRYHNCCIDDGTSPEYFLYHLVCKKQEKSPFRLQTCLNCNNNPVSVPSMIFLTLFPADAADKMPFFL